jgi:hypothetical protein
MHLRDLMENTEKVPDQRYDAKDDESVQRPDDTRKVRLTLEQINKLRRMQEVRKIEQKKQEDFFKTIYGAPPAAPAG